MLATLPKDIRPFIIQAPMAGVSTPEMAAAVSNSGAVGSIAIGGLGPDEAVFLIQKTKALTDRPFNINFFCHDPFLRVDAEKDSHWRTKLNDHFLGGEMILNTPLKNIYTSIKNNKALAIAVAAQAPDIISFHFGVPDDDIIDIFRQTGAKLMATATCLEEGKEIAVKGLDAIIAQGFEAGGHRGQFNLSQFDEKLSTHVLTRLLAQHLSLPIIAAGGIMTGADIASVMLMGAQGVQLGSAFIGCSESGASHCHKNLLKCDKSIPTVLTRAISGRPARSIVTPFVQWAMSITDEDIPEYPYGYDAFKQLQKSMLLRGDLDIGPFWAGQSACLTRFIPAAQIIAELENEYAHYIQG